MSCLAQEIVPFIYQEIDFITLPINKINKEDVFDYYICDLCGKKTKEVIFYGYLKLCEECYDKLNKRW